MIPRKPKMYQNLKYPSEKLVHRRKTKNKCNPKGLAEQIVIHLNTHEQTLVQVSAISNQTVW